MAQPGKTRFGSGYDESKMSIAPLPTPLEQFGGHRFAFYPAIRNIDDNEWLYRRATWSECVVANLRTGEEFWIPRQFLGDVSYTDDGAMVVGLSRELEWRAGAIIPRQRAVIEFPVTVDETPAMPRPGHLAPVINIRLEPKTEVRGWRWLGVAAVLGAVALAIVADFARQAPANRAYLQLGPGDDYVSVVRGLGLPARAETIAAGGRVFRVLRYPSRRYSVILMGPDADDARYIGAVDRHGRVLDSVRLGDGTSSGAVLSSRLAAGLR